MPASPAPAICLEHVVKIFPPGVRAVDDVTLAIPRGQFVVILGPSGCGKTTLLRTVNRLQEPTSGRIFVDGADALVQDPTLLRRGMGYVIQQVGLFAHMTVAENVAVVPQLLHWPADDVRRRVDELLDLVHLEPALFRPRYPRQLSGGQQQRVGLARALAADPDILLMDEPFGAVDAIERKHLQDEVSALQSRLRKTVLFVTHDVDEALGLADRIVVMRAGRVEQYGSPLEILAHPASDFVAKLVDAEDVFRRLALMKVESVMTPLDAATAAAAASPAVGLSPTVGSSPTATISADADLRHAFSRLVVSGYDSLAVVDRAGKLVGLLTIPAILGAARRAKLGDEQ